MRVPAWLLLACSLLGWTAHGSHTRLHFELRGTQSEVRPAELVETFGVEFLRDSVGLRLGARTTHEVLDWSRFDYYAQGTFSPLRWIELLTRLAHCNRLNESASSSTTTLLALLTLRGRFPHFIEWFMAFGVFHRTHRLLQPSALPHFHGTFSESDIALRLGLAIHLSNLSQLRVSLSTVEEIDVYNLHNPFVEGAWQTQWDRWGIETYLRYKTLLGFGRAEAWVGGLKLIRQL